MTPSAALPEAINSTDARLAELIDELTARLQAGEPVDLEACLRLYPEHAVRLEKLLPALRMLADVSSSRQQGVDAAVSAQILGELGDFRLLREVGRGGMGLVYEAVQISLNRRVALKVLPFAAALDERLLQRFRNEAQAAAGLHHTNIVPVYFVGCERGVHFFAMQLIEGRTLAAVIHELRGNPGEPGTIVPGGHPGHEATGSVETVAAGLSTEGPNKGKAYYRAVAQLGAQVALALEHAHERGVIHRDIKPGNLLLDGRGTPWVTDFGLAHLQHAEASLTMTGDLVGTLRYMSPEQALGKRVPIDHRTDVYSLGATLYELLTLRPAFAGSDRQELLRQIAFEEPPRPGRLDRRIPAELEIIVAKAMEKNPQERYATAQELADDLRHFLEDRPIQARRPTLVQRLRKWRRRHKAVFAATAVCLLVSLAALAGSIGWVARDRAAQRAGTQREVSVALRDADFWQQERRLPEALLAARRALALLAANPFEETLHQTVRTRVAELELVEKLENVRLEQSGIKDGGFDRELADSLFGTAFRDFGLDVEALRPEEAGGRIRRTTVATELASALDYWAWIRRRLKGPDDVSWKKLLGVARAADVDAWRTRLREAYQREDWQALRALADSAEVFRLPPATLLVLGLALRADQQAGNQVAAFLQQVQRRHPGDFWVNFDLAWNLKRSKPSQVEEAIRFYTVAAALRPQNPGVHINLGEALHARGRLDEAIAECREAIRLKKDFAFAHHNLGVMLRARGRLDEAIAAYQQALLLKKDAPQTYWSLGRALKDKGRLAEAMAAYQQAARLEKDDARVQLYLGIELQVRGKLNEAIVAYRKAIALKKDFAEAHNNLGTALKANGQLEEAITEHRLAIHLNKNDAGAHYHLGNALREKGQVVQAIAAYRQAVHLDKDHRNAHNALGNALLAKYQLDEAIACYKRAIEIAPRYAPTHYHLGNALSRQGKLAEAEAAYRKALALQPDFAQAHCNLGDVLLRQGRFSEALAERKRGHQLGSHRLDWRYPSAEWVRQAEQLVALDAKLPAILAGQAQPADAGEGIALAQLCQLYKQRYAAAVRFYAAAFKAQARFAEDLNLQHRCNAAWAAALAGCGHGKDADQSDDRERARLRRQSLAWLRAELDLYPRLLDKEPDKARPLVREALQLWQQQKAFDCVRRAEALARLPAEERAAWARLWADVTDLLARTKDQKPRNKEKPDKP
jgi:serine/threonine protein kinase/Flp pilus assembly protein TadD